MNRFLRKFVCMLVLVAYMPVNASEPVEETGVYMGAFRIASLHVQTSGAWVPGSVAGASTPLFYASGMPSDGSAYWEVRKVANGQYTLRNEKTGHYLTWDNQREDGSYTRRYVDLTEQLRGDSSRWTLSLLADNSWMIRNVYEPSHLMDLRVDSYVLGTYANAGSPAYNQKFCFYNKAGEQVTAFASSFATGVEGLSIGGHALVYDRMSSVYYCTVPDECLKSDSYTGRLDFELKDSNAELFLEDTRLVPGEEHTFTSIAGGRAQTMTFRTGTEEMEAMLVFTSLPLVQIYGDFDEGYKDATIRVTEPDVCGADTMIRARIRWRGATTRYRNKKQYAVKLYDENGEPRDVSFFGLRSDNNWILDGMVVDKARMRNRVVTDLWNNYARKPYYIEKEPKALTGTRGQYVELFLNGSYIGLYCMTEKIDRKQMKLKKYAPQMGEHSITGLLYKASDWSYSVFMGHNFNSQSYPMTSPGAYSNQSETWDGYEMKYPDMDDEEAIDWGDLYNAVNFVSTVKNTTFRAQVCDYFDYPALMDYYILMEIILSADNHGKNMYWGIYNRNMDKRLTPALWDLDSTCGRRWDASPINPEQNYTNYITHNEHGDFNLFRRLKLCNVNNFNDSVRYRYKELRKGALHTDSILARFQVYKERFDRCGVSEREKLRWTNTDVGTIDLDEEMEYLNDWFTKRMAYVDQQWNIGALPDLLPDGIEEPGMPSSLQVYAGARGEMVLVAGYPQEVVVCDASGRIVRRESVGAGTTSLNGFSKGLYLVGKRKVMIQ
ncbi:MAG: CotH kinase family protein [Paraprevotella sp.]|nr:CotH kinase family protein [Paraprevotella sp.]